MLFHSGDLCRSGEEETGLSTPFGCLSVQTLGAETSFRSKEHQNHPSIIHLMSSPGDQVFASPHLLCTISPFPECHLSVPQPLARAPGPAPLSCQSSDELLFPTLSGC